MEVASSANHTAQYISLGVLIILITLVVVLLRSKASRIIKYDVSTLTTVFFLLAILFLINAIPVTMHELALGSLKIPLEGRKDFTQNQRNTLTEQTIGILKDLKQDVTVVAMYQHGRPDEAAARDLFDQYQYYSKHFQYKFVDPYQDPVVALKYKDYIRLLDPQHLTINPGTIILEMEAPGANPPVLRKSAQLPTNGKPGEAEIKLSQALYQLLHQQKRTLYFTTGHGEKSPDAQPNTPGSLSAMKQGLENSQYVCKPLSLYKENKVPADADGVLVVGPQKDFEKSETDILGK
ncbi:MAG TPA: Gldg family protein, partial [Candidatus Xenobia bacterium]